MIKKEEILINKRIIKKEFYCIYALIKKNKIVYIGQSSNILGRLSSHLNSNKDFDSWSIIESWSYIDSDSFNEIEREYIKTFKPKYNNEFTKKRYKKKLRTKDIF